MRFFQRRRVITKRYPSRYLTVAPREQRTPRVSKEQRDQGVEQVTQTTTASDSNRQNSFVQDLQKRSKDEVLQRCESFLASEEMGRPDLTGVYFDGDGLAWGTDRHRLIALPTSHQKCEVISQRKEEDGSIRKILTGEFPYTKAKGIYDQIIRSEKYRPLVLHAKTFEDSICIIHDVLKKLLIEHVVLGVERDGAYLEVLSEDNANEKKADTLEHFRVYVGPAPAEIQRCVSYFNIIFLEQALQGAAGSVELRLNDTEKKAPLLLRRQDGEEHIIMPVEL